MTRPGALTDVLARNLLGRAGLKVPQDIRILAVGGGGTMLPAFKNRKIDILTISTPHPERMISEGLGIWFVNWGAGEDKAIKEFMMTAVMTTPKLMKERPGLVRRMTRAILKAQRYIQKTSVDQLTKDMTPFFGKRVSPKVLRISVQTVKGAVNPSGRQSDDAIQTTFKLMKSGGKLKNLKSVKRSDVWNDSFLK